MATARTASDLQPYRLRAGTVQLLGEQYLSRRTGRDLDCHAHGTQLLQRQQGDNLRLSHRPPLLSFQQFRTAHRGRRSRPSLPAVYRRTGTHGPAHAPLLHPHQHRRGSHQLSARTPLCGPWQPALRHRSEDCGRRGQGGKVARGHAARRRRHHRLIHRLPQPPMDRHHPSRRILPAGPAPDPSRHRRTRQHVLRRPHKDTVDRHVDRRLLPDLPQRAHRAARTGRRFRIRLLPHLLRGQRRHDVDGYGQRTRALRPAQRREDHLPARRHAGLHRRQERVEHRQGPTRHPVDWHLLRRRQLYESVLPDLPALPRLAGRPRTDEQRRGPHDRGQRPPPVDMHGRRRPQRTRPAHRPFWPRHRLSGKRRAYAQPEVNLFRRRPTRAVDRHPPRRTDTHRPHHV